MEIFERFPQTRIKGYYFLHSLKTYSHTAPCMCDLTPLSDHYDQEQGVPQGDVLSTTLFSIKINDMSRDM